MRSRGDFCAGSSGSVPSMPAVTCGQEPSASGAWLPGGPGELATAADGSPRHRSVMAPGGTRGPLPLLALGFLAFSCDFFSGLLGTFVGALPRLWPPPFSVCWGQGSSFTSRSCFLGSAGVTATSRPGGCGSGLGVQPGVPRAPNPSPPGPSDIWGPDLSAGASAPGSGGSPRVWPGQLSACLTFSFPGALRLFFPGGWLAGGWGAGGATGLGGEATLLCGPCFLALWRLRPGRERKEAAHTSQVTGRLPGARSFQWPFAVDVGFFLKARGSCLVPWGLRGSLRGVQ